MYSFPVPNDYYFEGYSSDPKSDLQLVVFDKASGKLIFNLLSPNNFDISMKFVDIKGVEIES